MWKVFDRTDTVSVKEYDAFVYSHNEGHFLQMSSWASVKTFWRWCGISVYRNSNMIAAMGVLIRPLPLGFSLLYAPRGPICNRDEPAVWEELMEGCRHLAVREHALLLHLDPDEPDSNLAFKAILRRLGFEEKADEGFGNIQPQFVFRLSLKDRSEDALLQSFSSKTRYNIGLACRKGVSVAAYSGEDPLPEAVLESFYSLMQITGQRDHFYIRSLSYFHGLMESLGKDAQLLLAYYNGEPIAGSIEVFTGTRAWYLYGASSNEHRSVMPNYLLQWQMIRQAKARGCRMYDFRGVPGNVTQEHPLYGLYRFKRGFSGTHTKFSGLFTYKFRPLLCRILEFALWLRRKLRGQTRRNS